MNIKTKRTLIVIGVILAAIILAITMSIILTKDMSIVNNLPIY